MEQRQLNSFGVFMNFTNLKVHHADISLARIYSLCKDAVH